MEKIRIWVQCWKTTHAECINISRNEFAELRARSVLTVRAGGSIYWYNGPYSEFRKFLVGKASI